MFLDLYCSRKLLEQQFNLCCNYYMFVLLLGSTESWIITHKQDIVFVQ